MPFTLGKRTTALSGVITIEDVEPLAAWLRDTPRPTVNLRRCTVLHTAVLQALLAARASVSVPPTDEFLRRWILPLFDGVEPADTLPMPSGSPPTDGTA